MTSSFASIGHVFDEVRGTTLPFPSFARYNSDFCAFMSRFSSNKSFSRSSNILRQTGAIFMSALISKGMKFLASTTFSPSFLASCFLETKKLTKFDTVFCFLRSASNLSSSFRFFSSLASSRFLRSSSLASSRFLRSSSFASLSFCFCLEADETVNKSVTKHKR